jgi:hypothetical protein
VYANSDKRTGWKQGVGCWVLKGSGELILVDSPVHQAEGERERGGKRTDDRMIRPLQLLGQFRHRLGPRFENSLAPDLRIDRDDLYGSTGRVGLFDHIARFGQISIGSTPRMLAGRKGRGRLVKEPTTATLIRPTTICEM